MIISEEIFVKICKLMYLAENFKVILRIAQNISTMMFSE